MLHQRRHEIDIMARPLDLEFVECFDLLVDGFQTGGCPGDQLGDHRVVEHRDFAAFDHAVIDADQRAVFVGAGFRRIIADKATGRWQEAAIGVFGIDAVLDRPAVDLDVILGEGQRLAIGDADHLFDQINAGDFLGNGMFDLQPSVHFEEVEALPRRVRTADDQFDRAGAEIADSAGERDALLAHRLAHLGRDEGRRRFLDHLLVAALDRTFALVQVNDIAMLVAQYLDFDMARAFDELLDEDAIVAEAGQAFALGRFKAFADILFIIGKPHPLATATGRRLHHHRVADLVGDFDGMFGVVNDADEARHDIDARFQRERVGRAIALARQHQRGRATTHQAATRIGTSVSSPCRSRLWPMMVSTSV